MPLDIPDRPALTARMQGYARTHVPELDPTTTTRRGAFGGLVKSLMTALRDWYATLKRYADYEPWPQTASENFLLAGWWIPITQLTRNPAAPALRRKRAAPVVRVDPVIPYNSRFHDRFLDRRP